MSETNSVTVSFSLNEKYTQTRSQKKKKNQAQVAPQRDGEQRQQCARQADAAHDDPGWAFAIEETGDRRTWRKASRPDHQGENGERYKQCGKRKNQSGAVRLGGRH